MLATFMCSHERFRSADVVTNGTRAAEHPSAVAVTESWWLSTVIKSRPANLQWQQMESKDIKGGGGML